MPPPIDQLVRSALAHQQAGRLSDAAALYDEILAGAPDRADLLHLRGICAFQAGETGAAERFVRDAVAADPREPDFANSLSIVLQERGAFDEAVAASEAALRRQPKHGGYRLTLGLAQYGANRRDEARKTLEPLASLSDANAQALAALGCLAFERGDDIAAAGLHRRAAASDPAFAWAGACVFGDRYRAWTADTAREDALAAYTALSGDRPADGDGPLVFAACDAGYFRRFAGPLVRSTDANAVGHDVHLHVMAPRDALAREAEALGRAVRRTRLTLSWETPPPGADRVYFSNMRFVRLWQLGVVGNRPVIALDADSLVRGPVADPGDAPVAAPLRPHLPWLNRKIVATSILFRAQAESARFLERFAAYILSAMAAGDAAWYLDQCAFAIVAEMTRRATGAPVVGALDPGCADAEMTDASCIWAAKGEGKADPRYLREAAGYGAPAAA